jgi:hypothetical protein
MHKHCIRATDGEKSRKVLIAPIAPGWLDWRRRIIPVELTMDQVRNSPGLDDDQPVSRAL